MRTDNRRKLAKRKGRIRYRLRERRWKEQSRPMLKASNIRYEMAGRTRAVRAGGIGAIHTMVRRLGLTRAIDEEIHLLKRHLPYHESDHILNIAYNMLAGHTKLEDIELSRSDESYLDMLGAQRIPDPTTAGDFLRRFAPAEIEKLMDVVNEKRVDVWRRQSREFRKRAVIDADGVITPTTGEKKRGMGMSYKGIWGYHPLLVSLANTQEPLYIVNRSGNAASHDDAAFWMDGAIALARRAFDEVVLRGDSAFSLTTNFDRWTDEGVTFYFGYDAWANLSAIADALPDSSFSPLRRRVKHDVQTEPRRKRENVKERIVREKGYENIRLQSEHVAEFAYTPTKCGRAYRMIVLRKNLTVEKGERALFDDVRYFFYVTNDWDCPAAQVVFEANDRCNQENLIEQLKNGVNALRVPMYDLNANWAYMVIASLAWTLKAWFGLLQPRQPDRDRIVTMEFKRFLHAVMLIPCQVIRAARRVTLRILAYTDDVRLLFRSLDASAQIRAP